MTGNFDDLERGADLRQCDAVAFNDMVGYAVDAFIARSVHGNFESVQQLVY